MKGGCTENCRDWEIDTPIVTLATFGDAQSNYQLIYEVSDCITM